ncbi:MAG: hypothetical protein K2N87_09585 [Eubacterium sp.]|nr:hypothetical protein [Eubacterium sp.]
MKKTIWKKLMLVITLATLTFGSNTTAFAEAAQTEVLATVSDEEYAQYLQQNTTDVTNYAVDNNAEDEMTSLKELMQGQPELPSEYIREENRADGIILPIEDESAMTIPQSYLTAYVINPESLKNGLATTDTQIAWLWTFSDDDGDSFQDFQVGGFPKAYYLEANSNGFVTQFTNPGNYTVLYRAMDSRYEYSEIVGYRLTVNPVEDYQVIEDELTTETDTKTYNIDIDYSTMDASAICFVRMGQSYVTAQVKDESGNIIKTVGAAKQQPKRWIYIDKPTQDATIVHYTVTVTSSKYVAGSSQFRLVYGDKKDMEAMISGPENATPLEWYTEKESNFIHTQYTPNKDECWFKFTANQSMATFTLLGDHTETRFKIVDMGTLLPLFDSNADGNSSIHKDKFCGAFDYAEKAKIQGMTAGKEYYLVIYARNQISIADFLEDTINVAVGLPHMQSDMTEWIGASNQISATSSAFSSDAVVYVGDNGVTIPKNAYATKVRYSASRPSSISYWRVKEPSSSVWRQSKNYGLSIDIDYEDDSSSNKNINGIWRVGFRASNTTLSFTPSIIIHYEYELGD